MDRYIYVFISVTVIVLSLWVSTPAQAAIPAFPGAEGAGSDATGGRGQTVYHVTNLDESGPGSLRDALSQSNRIIVFDVGGTIRITNASQSDQWFRIGTSNITVAGQTAPGDGIFVYGTGTKFTGTNVVLRNMHFRPGPWPPDPNNRTCDGIWSEAKDSIIDHCSVEWATDEGISSTDAANNMTVQYCFIAEGLNRLNHSYGGMIGFDTDNGVITYHHNLFAHNRSRNPRIGNVNSKVNVVDFRNNVMYDWGSNCGYSTNNEEGDVQFIGNYYIAGPSTSSGDRSEAFSGGQTKTNIWQSGNKIDTNLNGVFDGTDTGWSMFTGSYTKQGGSYTVPNVTTDTADAALQRVLNYGGADWWNRDTVDARVTNQVQTGTGKIINEVGDVGGFTYYPEVHRSADFDTDQDGMPDTWELAHGLDPNVDDHNGDFDVDGYTNIEEYLNELAAFPAPGIISWTGGDANRYEVITNWSIPWQPTLADRVEINTGKATVAYIDQEAGTLYVGNAAGSTAGQVAVTSGRLTVAKNVYLGNASSARGTMNLTGGSTVVGDQIVLAAVASSTGNLTVGKDAYLQAKGLTVNSGSGRSTKVSVELANGDETAMNFTGASSFAGVMDVQVLSGYRPREGDRFTIMTSSDPNGVYFSGDFSSFTSNITTGLQGGLSAFDGNANGSIYDLVFRALTAGDASGDHKVDLGDLGILSGHWNNTSGTMTWQAGDFSGDGKVDLGDLGILSGNWGWVMPSGAPEMPIPEPASAVLLTLAAAAMLRRHSKRA